MRLTLACAVCCLFFCYCSNSTSPETDTKNDEKEAYLPSARPPRAGSIQDTLLGDWLLNASVNSFDKRVFDDGYALADSARILFEELLGKHMKTAKAINQMGRSKHGLSQFEEAIRLYERAGDIRRELVGENSEGVAMVYNNIGLAYNGMHRYEKSLNYHRKALAIRLKILGGNDALTATSYDNIGSVYENSGEYLKALEYFEKVIIILEAQKDANPSALAISTGNIGNIWQHLGNYKKALEYRFKALDLWEMSNHQFREYYQATVISNIGVTYHEMGDHFQAKDYYLKSLAMRKNISNMDTLTISSSYNNIGTVNNDLKEHDLALHYFEQARELLQANVPWDHPYLGIIYSNLGVTYNKMEDYHKAIPFYNKALDIAESRKDTLHMALSRLNRSTSYYMLEDYAAAQPGFEKALELWKAKLGEYHPYLAAAYRNIGLVHGRKQEYEKALRYYFDALRVSRYEMRNFHRVNSIQNVMEVLQEISVTYKAKFEMSNNLGDLEEADKYSQLSLDAMVYQSHSFQQQNSRTLWRDKNYTYFENAVDIKLRKAAHLNDPSYFWPAFELAEKGKGLALQSQIREMDALQFAGIPGKLIEEEQDLRVAITWKEKQCREALNEGYLETDSVVLAIGNELTDLRLAHKELKDQFESDYPVYFRLKYDVSTADSSYLRQSLLKKNQSLLEYLVGDSSIYFFVITPDKAEARQARLDFDLTQLVKQMRKGIIDMQDPAIRTAVATQHYAEAARSLYDAIFLPVADLLSGSEKVIIIPDGELADVPFDALLREAPEDIYLLPLFSFLLKDYQISYNYSASLLREMQEKNGGKRSRKTWLGVAPSFTGEPMQDISRFKFSPLSWNKAEVLAIKVLADGDVLLGEEAKEKAFLELAPNYQILHLSTHGQADRLAGDDSFLAFSEEPNGIEDEILFARELYNQRLHADLIVLSACETGVGEWRRGEGVISLARGFSYAGAKSIVTTLWKVNDQPSKVLLERFYEHLLTKKLSKDEALRQAKLDLLSGEHQEPFYWAAFVPLGDMEAIQLSHRCSPNWVWWILGLVIGGFLLFWFIYRKRQA